MPRESRDEQHSRKKPRYVLDLGGKGLAVILKLVLGLSFLKRCSKVRNTKMIRSLEDKT